MLTLIKCLILRLLGWICVDIVNAHVFDTLRASDPIILCAAPTPSVSGARCEATRNGPVICFFAFDCLNQEHSVQVLQTAGRGDLCST
jgi:hypothetical protein